MGLIDRIFKRRGGDRVLPIIRCFHEEGYNVWFDRVLPIGEIMM